jgi:predicted DNA-binding ribbon-helix-helix protein
MRLSERITYRLSRADREALENIAEEKKTTIGDLLRQITKTTLYNE